MFKGNVIIPGGYPCVFRGNVLSETKKIHLKGLGSWQLLLVSRLKMNNKNDIFWVVVSSIFHFYTEKHGETIQFWRAHFFQMGCNQYVYVCFGSGSLNRNHIGILPLGGGAWSMSNHFFFSTQDISFEASGCALRVQGFMSSVPRHLEAL